MIAGHRPDRMASLKSACALSPAIVVSLVFSSVAHAATWKKHRGELAPESADCIDLSSIKTDAKGLTHFRWYVIDDERSCGRPTRDV